MERSFLAENIHVKTREPSQNTDLDMQESSGIDTDLATEGRASLKILS